VSAGKPVEPEDDPLGEGETAARPDLARPNTPTPAPRPGARFTPGAIVAGRYRIVALLGRGGMGEVYRAEDTKLGHPVALKFLPESLAADASRLERLFGEVRIGRQISHPNVCRLYDVVEAEGQHFVTMEYVDGEDLASLLRRIGRLPGDKALEIARHICAGLAAAHDRGVVHRDLKPANVMIDGRGTARLTDFGLAALMEDVQGYDVTAGTPAYMAPEQLAGKEVTFKSDLFALGLILYEMFSGKRRFEAKTLSDLMALHRDAKTLSLSSTLRDIDPAVERVIARCLDEDPAGRPGSAHAVIAALPGGDPLQAALEAGETPSPEMVAASGRVGDLAPAVAWACLAGVLAGLLAVSLLSAKTTLLRRVPLPKSPEVLVERAQEFIAKLGYDAAPADSAYRFDADHAHIRYVSEHGAGSGRWDTLAGTRPGPVLFYYRQSPRSLVAQNIDSYVGQDDPPMLVSGMATVEVDPQGRLVEFTAVPPQHDDAKGSGSEPNWSPLLTEAGLDTASLTPAASTWAAPVDSDRKAAWDGTYPGQPDVPIHVEAASYRGKPVWFAVFGPWSRPLRQEEALLSTTQRIGQRIFLCLAVVLQIGAVLLARRNLRLGRGDRRGAFALSAFVLGVTSAAFLIRAHHIPAFFDEYLLIVKALAFALYSTVGTWVLYVALEPYVRRRWPHMLIAWNRLLAGGIRDPLVGRDLLVGALAGLASSVVAHLDNLAPAWFGMPPVSPYVQWVSPLTEVRHLVFTLINELRNSVIGAMALVCLLLLMRVILRRQRLAIVAVFLLMVATGLRGENVPVEVVGSALIAALLVVMLLRFGLFSLACAIYFSDAVDFVPLSLDPSVWYAGRSFLVLGLLAALAFYGFHTSLGGKPMFGAALED
jgi:serine/threonine-protein kinase